MQPEKSSCNVDTPGASSAPTAPPPPAASAHALAGTRKLKLSQVVDQTLDAKVKAPKSVICSPNTRQSLGMLQTEPTEDQPEAVRHGSTCALTSQWTLWSAHPFQALTLNPVMGGWRKKAGPLVPDLLGGEDYVCASRASVGGAVGHIRRI